MSKVLSPCDSILNLVSDDRKRGKRCSLPVSKDGNKKEPRLRQRDSEHTGSKNKPRISEYRSNQKKSYHLDSRNKEGSEGNGNRFARTTQEDRTYCNKDVLFS